MFTQSLKQKMKTWRLYLTHGIMKKLHN